MSVQKSSPSKVDDVKLLTIERDAFRKMHASGRVDLRETAEAAKALDEEKKTSIVRRALIGSIIVSLVIIVAQRAITIYLKHKDFIQQLGKDAPPNWPTNAYMTAAVVEIPALSGLTGFTSPALPIAALYCYSSANIYPKFKPNATDNLASMFLTSVEGSRNPDDPPSFNAVTIICKAWLNKNNPGTDLCVTPCPQIQGVGWANVASSAIGGATGMAFAGHAIGGAVEGIAGGPVALAGGIIGGLVSAGATYFDQKRREKQEAANTNGRACLQS